MSDRANSFDFNDLLRCSRGEMFGVGNPQLPLPPMLMIDRISAISADGGTHGLGHVIAELDIKPDLWFFECHFSGDPVMPGCLGLDALWQITGFNLGWRGLQGQGRALGVGGVKFSGMIKPVVQQLRYEINFCRIVNRRIIIGTANGMVFADDKLVYQAKNIKVGLF